MTARADVTGISNMLKVEFKIFKTNELTLSKFKSLHLLLRVFAGLLLPHPLYI